MLVQTFIRMYSSHFMHRTSKERHKTYTTYADTGVLQTICVESALRLELKKRYMFFVFLLLFFHFNICIYFIFISKYKKRIYLFRNKLCMRDCKPGYLSLTIETASANQNQASDVCKA